MASFRPLGCRQCSLKIQYISLFFRHRHSNRLIVYGDIKSMEVTLYGFSTERWCMNICLETLCVRKPCLMLAQCLLISGCNLCVVLPTYCIPQTHTRKYTTYCDWQFKWCLMPNFSFVQNETKSFRTFVWCFFTTAETASWAAFIATLRLLGLFVGLPRMTSESTGSHDIFNRGCTPECYHGNTWELFFQDGIFLQNKPIFFGEYSLYVLAQC